MPVKSQAQFKWMAINRPDLLHKFQKEGKREYKNLPKKASEKLAEARMRRK